MFSKDVKLFAHVLKTFCKPTLSLSLSLKYRKGSCGLATLMLTSRSKCGCRLQDFKQVPSNNGAYTLHPNALAAMECNEHTFQNDSVEIYQHYEFPREFLCCMFNVILVPLCVLCVLLRFHFRA